jgi:spore maturation protein SpmB
MYAETFQPGMHFMRGFFICTEITPNLVFCTVEFYVFQLR